VLVYACLYVCLNVSGPPRLRGTTTRRVKRRESRPIVRRKQPVSVHPDGIRNATQPHSHPAIEPSSHPAIQPSSNPAIQPCSHPVIQPSSRRFCVPTVYVIPHCHATSAGENLSHRGPLPRPRPRPAPDGGALHGGRRPSRSPARDKSACGHLCGLFFQWREQAAGELKQQGSLQQDQAGGGSRAARQQVSLSSRSEAAPERDTWGPRRIALVAATATRCRRQAVFVYYRLRVC
jgi:hypothetical protein